MLNKQFLIKESSHNLKINSYEYKLFFMMFLYSNYTYKQFGSNNYINYALIKTTNYNIANYSYQYNIIQD